MPPYLIERSFAEQLELTDEDVRLVEAVNADEGVQWLFSFLTADKRKTYCPYDAPSPDAIRAAAQREPPGRHRRRGRAGPGRGPLTVRGNAAPLP